MAGKERFSNLFKEREYGYWEPLYDFGRVLCTLYFRTVMNVDVKGSKHIPEDGPFVIYSNHMTAYDPPILGHSFSRKTHYMGREELFTHKLCRQFGFSKLIRLLGCFPVNRENPSSLTLKIIKEIISQDEGFIMFPQGTRKHGKNLAAEQFQPGMTKFLLGLAKKKKKNIAIVPAYIDYFSHGVDVRFSEPFYAEDHLPAQKDTADKLTRTIAEQIIKLSTE